MQTTHTQLQALSGDVAALAAAAAPSIVAVEYKRRAASGFYWRSDVVATASEILEARKGDTVAVRSHAGDAKQGTVIGHDASTDLALIRVPSAGMPLPAAAPSRLDLGHAVLVLGRTGFGPTAALGFVSLAGASWRSMRGGEITQRLWLDLRMMRSSEGGAVIDSLGGFVGMAVFGPRRRIVVVPGATIERAGTEVLAYGRIRHGYMGVSVQPVPMPATSDADRAMGLMVLGLDDNGPAAAAGLLRGDIMTAVDGVQPKSPRGLMRLLPGSTIGTSKRVDLVRAGQTTHLDIIIGEHSDQ